MKAAAIKLMLFSCLHSASGGASCFQTTQVQSPHIISILEKQLRDLENEKPKLNENLNKASEEYHEADEEYLKARANKKILDGIVYWNSKSVKRIDELLIPLYQKQIDAASKKKSDYDEEYEKPKADDTVNWISERKETIVELIISYYKEEFNAASQKKSDLKAKKSRCFDEEINLSKKIRKHEKRIEYLKIKIEFANYLIGNNSLNSEILDKISIKPAKVTISNAQNSIPGLESFINSIQAEINRFSRFLKENDFTRVTQNYEKSEDFSSQFEQFNDELDELKTLLERLDEDFFKSLDEAINNINPVFSDHKEAGLSVEQINSLINKITYLARPIFDKFELLNNFKKAFDSWLASLINVFAQTIKDGVGIDKSIIADAMGKFKLAAEESKTENSETEKSPAEESNKDQTEIISKLHYLRSKIYFLSKIDPTKLYEESNDSTQAKKSGCEKILINYFRNMDFEILMTLSIDESFDWLNQWRNDLEEFNKSVESLRVKFAKSFEDKKSGLQNFFDELLVYIFGRVQSME